MDKQYIRAKVRAWLNKAEKEEIEILKEIVKENPEDERISDLCTALGIFVALRIKTDELIEKL